MNELLEMLSGGNLRSDGRANDVADKVVRHPHLLVQLVEGLSETDDVIRARTAHALERISRTHHEMLLGLLPQFMEMADSDDVPMVKWHLAMIFGNLTFPEEKVSLVISTLLRMLKDKSVFVRSWSIVSLTILGRKYGSVRKNIAGSIQSLQYDDSSAIRNKVMKALKVLNDNGASIPAGWAKHNSSRQLKNSDKSNH